MSEKLLVLPEGTSQHLTRDYLTTSHLCAPHSALHRLHCCVRERGLHGVDNHFNHFEQPVPIVY